MKISVKREDGFREYEVDARDATLLEALVKIKTELDNTLAFSSGCRSGVCGSCSVRVNSKGVLACARKVQDGDRVEPLNNVNVIRDLVVDMEKSLSFNEKSKAWLNVLDSNAQLNDQTQMINELQSDCVLCGLCYSACPVYSVNSEFLGPFALTRVWKYVGDKRELGGKEKLDAIQTNGVWDCTLCNECAIVCPQEISSKADIEKLRAKSSMAGYEDPTFAQSFSFGSFDGSPSF